MFRIPRALGWGGVGGSQGKSWQSSVPLRPSNPDPVKDNNCSFHYPVQDMRYYFLTLICFVLHTELSNVSH